MKNKIKIAIGSQVTSGPWGGGSAFVRSLSNSMLKAGHSVVYDLKSSDIDIILLTDPRRIENITFGPGCAYRYLLFKNQNAIIVHRINECDERKNTYFINRLLKRANYIADHTIFISEWLKSLHLWHNTKDFSIIRNGADTDLFFPGENISWNKENPLKLVTHHWSNNSMKGFDIYLHLDKMIGTMEWRNKIRFTYIGNVPKGISMPNSEIISPLSGKELQDKLSEMNVYVTGSINEPAGMHHIEGALCGLPLLYRLSGALPEYCHQFGVPFLGKDDFCDSLTKMIKNYDKYKNKMKLYENTASNMNRSYVMLFKKLVADKTKLIKKRGNKNNFYLKILNLISF